MRDLWTDGGGSRLFAVEDGAGAVVLMLHGGMADHRAVLPLVAPLAARYRVIAPDVRGSGRSWWAGPLSFDQLADDVARVLDRVGADRAVVGGASGGTGVALRFARRHPGRAAALVLVQPVYAGAARGYTADQQTAFAAMDALASRATAEGVQVLRPLYAQLPDGIRERALQMLAGFDAASVAATSHFIASGAQPFASDDDLRSLRLPTLVVRGADPLHPAAVSELYAALVPDALVLPAGTADVSAAIGAFLAARVPALSVARP